MLEFNKPYLNTVKQELVNTVAKEPYITPEIFISIIDMPRPNVPINEHDIKTRLRFERRKDISQIWNNNPTNANKLVRDYHEKELLNFLKIFPQFKGVLK